MTTSSSLPVGRDLLNAAFKIGKALDRKFEATDMTPALRQAAMTYAATYELRPEGDDFMRDMQTRVVGLDYLSDGQAKGVLNVMMADARRRLAARAPKGTAVAGVQPVVKPPAVLAAVPDGRYRVTLVDGQHLAIKVTLAGRDSKLNGSRVVSTRINGDEWMGCAHISPAGDFRLWRSCTGDLRSRVENAVEILDSAETQDQWLVAGLAFAQEGSQCFICGRDLDTPESLTAGYGPVCADKHGLPWGAKAIPMSVRLAQAAAAQAAPSGVTEPTVLVPVTEGPLANHPDFEFVKEAAPAWKSPVSITEARTRGFARRYDEIFGEENA